jgi:hypothetical protein
MPEKPDSASLARTTPTHLPFESSQSNTYECIYSTRAKKLCLVQLAAIDTFDRTTAV